MRALSIIALTLTAVGAMAFTATAGILEDVKHVVCFAVWLVPVLPDLLIRMQTEPGRVSTLISAGLPQLQFWATRPKLKQLPQQVKHVSPS